MPICTRPTTAATESAIRYSPTLRLLADAHAPNRRRRPDFRVLHEEARPRRLRRPRAGRAAYERQGTIPEVRQDPVADRLVIPRDVELRGPDLREHDAVGMRDRDAGDRRPGVQLAGLSTSSRVSRCA